MKVLLTCVCLVIGMASSVLSVTIPDGFTLIKAPGNSPAASKDYMVHSEKGTFKDAIGNCSKAGWKLARVENNIEQAELEQHALNNPELTQQAWIDGMYYKGAWHTIENQPLNYTNFFQALGYCGSCNPPANSCLTVVPLHMATAPPPHIYKWFACNCNEVKQIICQK